MFLKAQSPLFLNESSEYYNLEVDFFTMGVSTAHDLIWWWVIYQAQRESAPHWLHFPVYACWTDTV